MSVEATTECWGPQFPSRSATVRLVALAIADGVVSGREVLTTDSWYEQMRARTGLSQGVIEAAIDRLCRLDVIQWIGSVAEGDRYRWL